jgi:subtilisin family serine protease
MTKIKNQKSKINLSLLIFLPACLLLFTACPADPPGDGFLFISISADRVAATDINEIRVTTTRVEIVMSDSPTGATRIYKVPGTENLQLPLIFDTSNKAFTTATLPIPPGLVHQVRLITDGAEIRGPAAKNGTDVATVPSGPQTGIKIELESGEAFQIKANEVTKIAVDFLVSHQINRPGGGFHFKPTLKATLVEASTDLPFTPYQLNVRFNNGVSRTEMNAIVAAYDARAAIMYAIEPLRSLFAIKIPDDKNLYDATVYFQDHPKVKWAGPNILFQLQADNPRPAGAPNDPLFAAGQSYLRQIHAPNAWDKQIGSTSVIVAVIDTGATLTHPDLVANLFFNVGEIPPSVTIVDADGDGVIGFRDLNAMANAGKVRDSNSNGFIDGDDVLAPIASGGLADGIDNDAIVGEMTNVVDDLVGAHFAENARQQVVTKDNDSREAQMTSATKPVNGHGTHTSGILGAVSHNGLLMSGLAWNIRILPVRTCGNTACDITASLMHGFRYARRMGASVVNLSQGVSQDTQTTNAQKVDSRLFSIGRAVYLESRDDANSATAIPSDIKPETMLIVIAAGNDNKNCDLVQIACMPNEFNIDNKIIVGAVDSTDSKADFSNFGTLVDVVAPGVDILSLNRNGLTQISEGTSFAAPMVAGTAALAISQKPSLKANIGALRSLLLENADILTPLKTVFGEGKRLNVERAVNAAAVP